MAVLRAHQDPVNHHKLLDANTLLTASDDTTILLWDLRRIGGDGGFGSSRVDTVPLASGAGARAGDGAGYNRPAPLINGGSRALVDCFGGHSNWVKNLEPLSRTQFLSSDLGGDVRIWDVNRDGTSKCSDFFDGRRCNSVLKHKLLCRMTVIRDSLESKLVVSLRDRNCPGAQ